MSLISRLLHAVQSWRRRPGGLKTTKRAAAVSMEQLDHRQLLSVNFSGNVAIDFPATQVPGVVVIPATAPSATAGVPPIYTSPPNPPPSAINVSGFSLSGIRVSYDSTDDVLSIGLDQPPSGPGSTHSVIAGDADDNGNDGTVSPEVQAIVDSLGLSFIDFPDFGGSEFMGAFLDLNQDGYADIVAGYADTDARTPKQYQVAQAIVNTNAPPTNPGFGTPLPQFTGNVYKVNSPVHPNLEFAINNFSQLYLQETGQTLTPDKVISFGAFAGSGDDDGIGEAFFPQVPVPFENTIVPPPTPPPPPVCPPLSPPVVINPHQNNHINTAHPTDIRVSVLGTSGFDVTQIDPATVTFGGASPVFSFFRRVNGDQFLDQTFVFKGTDVHLPPGITEAPIMGSLKDGQTFVTSMRVFNRDASFYSPAEVSQAQSRQAANPNRLQTPVSVLQRRMAFNGATASRVTAARVPGGPSAVQVRSARVAQAQPAAVQVVSIPRRQPVVKSGQRANPKISTNLQSSMDAFVNDSYAGMDMSSMSSS